MGKLYDTASEFEELFNRFDEISEWEPDQDADGNFIDANGEIIDDVVEIKTMLLDAWFDTCDGLKSNFKIFAESMAAYIKSVNAEVEAIKAEEKALKARREQKERKIRGLMDYLKGTMDRMELKKIDMPKAKITIQNNPQSCVIDDAASLMKWIEETGHEECLKRIDPEIRKTQVKDLINSGEDVPFAHIERTQSLRIK